MTDKQRRAASFIRLARECSRDSWQHPQNRSAFLLVKTRAMTEARAFIANNPAPRALFLVG